MDKKEELANDLSRILEVLDIYIEMESNTAKAYREMAHEAKREDSRAILAWLYNNATARFLRMAKRRRVILGRYNNIIKEDGSDVKTYTGLTKTSGDYRQLARRSPMDILRYASGNEARAMRYFLDRALLTDDPSLKLMLCAAVKEQQDQMHNINLQREAYLHEELRPSTEQHATKLG